MQKLEYGWTALCSVRWNKDLGFKVASIPGKFVTTKKEYGVYWQESHRGFPQAVRTPWLQMPPGTLQTNYILEAVQVKGIGVWWNGSLEGHPRRLTHCQWWETKSSPCRSHLRLRCTNLGIFIRGLCIYVCRQECTSVISPLADMPWMGVLWQLIQSTLHLWDWLCPLTFWYVRVKNESKFFPRFQD